MAADSDRLTPGSSPRLRHVEKADYEAIIAVSEDPSVTSEDVRGHAPSADSINQVADISDTLFYRRPLEKQIADILQIPTHISARRLARMADREREQIVSHLTVDLAKEIISILPVSVS